MVAFAKRGKSVFVYSLTAVVGVGVAGNTDPVSAGFSEANTKSVTFKASIAVSCKLSAPVPVSFGTYDPVVTNATAPLDANGAFNIKCNKGGAGDISISSGDNNAGPNRRMKRAGSNDFLTYDLYTTAARTTVWNTVNIVVYTAANSSDVTRAVYGRIPGAQIDAVAGTYSDTVVVTVSY